MGEQIAGRVVLITGAARGIGRATAQALLAAGARVAVCDLQGASDTAAQLASVGPQVRGYELDVRDFEAFCATVERVSDDLGPVDVLVNNAGIMPLGGFLAQPLATDRRQLEVNLFGVVHGMRATLPGMAERGRGHVVNIASAAGRIPLAQGAVYAASKAAVIQLTESVRAEYIDSAVRFTYVLPSLVRTDLISGLGRPLYPPVCEPADVAAAVLKAIETGRVDVYVPRFARLGAVLPAVLPRRVVEALGRFLGVDSMFADVDASARAAYAERIRE